MNILGIETSCDDTSVAIYANGNELSHVSFSQIDILEKWGGVVPEIAARNHLVKIPALVDQALQNADIKLSEITLVGVTTQPGLAGPLLTGLAAAKTIALLNKIPILPVNHLYAHLEAIHITEKVSYPYFGVLISGGHTLFLYVKDPNTFDIVGSTIDDAIGEAFDKAGKMLGLGYPAGAKIDKIAQKGNDKSIIFPSPLSTRKDCMMSFSGLKTAIRKKIDEYPELLLKNKTPEQEQFFCDVVSSFQKSLIKHLHSKFKVAYNQIVEEKQMNNLPIVIGGGVACNSKVRQVFSQSHKNIHFVAPQYCADNGAMIANYTSRVHQQAIPFPDCLSLDIRGKFIEKKNYV